jgi:hypothetical protein
VQGPVAVGCRTSGTPCRGHPVRRTACETAEAPRCTGSGYTAAARAAAPGPRAAVAADPLPGGQATDGLILAGAAPRRPGVPARSAGSVASARTSAPPAAAPRRPTKSATRPFSQPLGHTALGLNPFEAMTGVDSTDPRPARAGGGGSGRRRTGGAAGLPCTSRGRPARSPLRVSRQGDGSGRSGSVSRSTRRDARGGFTAVVPLRLRAPDPTPG